MVTIKISKAYDKFRRRIGIGFNEIRQTITKPDRVTTINLNDLEKKVVGYSEGKPLILKIFLRKNVAHNLLVLSQVKDKEEIVNIAVRIFPSSLLDFQNVTPIEALRSFVDNFGVYLTISNKKSKFFYGELIQYSMNANISLVAPIITNPPKGHEVLETAFIKVIGITYEVFCGLAFCIDYTAYLGFLKQREFKV